MPEDTPDDRDPDFPNIPIPPHIRKIGDALKNLPPDVLERVLSEHQHQFTEMMQLLNKRNDTPDLITDEDAQRMSQITNGIMESIRRAMTERN